MSTRENSKFEEFVQLYSEGARERLAELAVTTEVALQSVQQVLEPMSEIDQLRHSQSTHRRLQAPAHIQRMQESAREPYVAAALYCLELNGIELGFGVEETSRADVETPREPPVPVTILVDPEKNLAINGIPVSLERGTQRVDTNYEVTQARDIGLRLVQLFAIRPNQQFQRNDIWAAIMGDAEFDRRVWDQYMYPLLANPPMVEGRPYVDSEFLPPKRNIYSLGNFEVVFGETAETLDVEDADMYVLPNGRGISGISGKILRKMARGWITIEDFEGDPSFTNHPGVVAGKRRPSQVLSSRIAAIKSHYKKDLQASGVAVATVRFSDNRSTAYFLERRAPHGKHQEPQKRRTWTVDRRRG